jgi:Spy/CpxP family protein refolding chaperone
MKRNWKIAIGAALSALILGVGAGAMAGPGFHGGPGGRHGHMMKKFVGAVIDDALDEAKVTPQQREQIHAARDKALQAIESRHGDHKEHMEKALRLFEQDRVDRGQLDALRAEREADMRAVSDAVTDALVEAHDVLTPAQRHTVAEYVRSHHPGRGDR